MSSDAEVPADRAPIPGTGLPGRVLLDVNMGYEVQQLTQSGEYVEITAARFEPDADLGHAEAPARRQVRSRCVAGADGANSFVREKLGIGVADLGFEEKTPACRCPCPPLPREHVAYWLNWRRRHQARSRSFHQRTRLSRQYALAS